ncbi:MAG: hypothetical protein IJT18_07295 [Oscillospiraceae bacterium]|nr:hypothetical protein [Oscillospiraceae bacterium]
MSLKDSWKETGKGIGKTFAGLGKAIVKSVEVGVDRATGDDPENAATDLRESWSEVGHSFGKTGKSLGKAAAETAKRAEEAIDDAVDGKPKDETAP